MFDILGGVGGSSQPGDWARWPTDRLVHLGISQAFCVEERRRSKGGRLGAGRGRFRNQVLPNMSVVGVTNFPGEHWDVPQERTWLNSKETRTEHVWTLAIGR